VKARVHPNPVILAATSDIEGARRARSQEREPVAANAKRSVWSAPSKWHETSKVHGFSASLSQPKGAEGMQPTRLETNALERVLH